MKTRERKKSHGEVFTPRSLVLEMIEKIELVPDKIYLDNSCGNGQFLIELLKHLSKTFSKYKKIQEGMILTTLPIEIQNELEEPYNRSVSGHIIDTLNGISKPNIVKRYTVKLKRNTNLSTLQQPVIIDGVVTSKSYSLKGIEIKKHAEELEDSWGIITDIKDQAATCEWYTNAGPGAFVVGTAKIEDLVYFSRF